MTPRAFFSPTSTPNYAQGVGACHLQPPRGKDQRKLKRGSRVWPPSGPGRPTGPAAAATSSEGQPPDTWPAGKLHRGSRGLWGQGAAGAELRVALASCGDHPCLLPLPLHTQGSGWLPGSPGAHGPPSRGLLFCGGKRRVARGLGFPVARETRASRPQAERLTGNERKGLVCSRGLGHPVSTHGTDGGSDLTTA